MFAGSSFEVELNGPTPGTGHDQIDLTHLRGILEDPHRLEVRVAQLAFDAQAVLAHRFEVRTARDERDRSAG